MNSATNRLRGRVVELLRVGDLLEEPVPHHRHAIAHRHCLGLVVRDVDRRHPEVTLEPCDLRAHLHSQLRVQVRERLVHQERLRVADDCPTHCDALALTARECAGLLVQRVGEAEDPRHLADAALDLVLLEAAHLRSAKPMFFAAFMCG